MKILFLDIDGVLISNASARKYGVRKADPELVKLLNQITHATGAQIVVSSTWRVFDDIEKILVEWGVTAPVMGKTCYPHGLARGIEIHEWLLETKLEIERFAILDDDQCMEPLMGHLVLTKWATGLTSANVELAIRKLGLCE